MDPIPGVIERVVAAVAEGRPDESVVVVPTSTPGVHFLRTYTSGAVIHGMLLLDDDAARGLPGSARPGLSLASRLLDRGQAWLVVPKAYVPTAQATLREHGHEARVGGYDLDHLGKFRLRWW